VGSNQWRFTGSSHNPLTAILQMLIGKTGDKGISFGLQRFRQHPAGTFPSKLCQRIDDRFRLAKWQDRCIFIYGVPLLVRFWLALTPATIRRPSNHAITQIPA